MGWHYKEYIYAQEDTSKKHYYITGTKFSAMLTYSGNTSYMTNYFYFDCEELGGSVSLRNIQNGQNNYAFTPAVASRIVPQTQFIISDYSSGWDEVSASGSGVYVYGEKANPVISSNFESGFIKYTEDKVINYSSGYISGISEQYTILSGILYYKKTTDTAYTSIAFTGYSATIPANTFEANLNYDMYSSITVDDGTVVNTDTKTATTIDATPTVTVINPNNDVIYGSCLFDWNYDVSTGMPQYAFDIQMSADNATWVDIISHEISESTTKQINSIDSAYAYWRVRGYNQINVESAWSAAGYFVNSTKPKQPIITEIIHGGRPIIKWSSSEQVAYRIVLGDYDTGEVYTTDKSCFINEYIQNEVYQCSISIANQYGLWSDVLEFEYSQNMSASVPVATITQIENGSQISITSEQFSKIYILRNGILIGKTLTRSFFDEFVNGSTVYTIRGVMADDTFADAEIEFNYVCRVSCLITKSGTVIPVNSRIDNKTGITYSSSRSYTANEYLGRNKRVYYENEMKYRSWQITCDSIEILSHIGETLFYRNYAGDSAWVICNSASSSENTYGHEVSATIDEIDYSEASGYDL